MGRGQPLSVNCMNCGSADVHRAEVRSAFWHGDRLVIVEGIPAIVCGKCSEQYYDDTTAVMLDLLRGEGFPVDKARDEMRVPIFSFPERPIAQGGVNDVEAPS